MCCRAAESTCFLKEALKETSRGSMILVQPAGTKIGVMLHSISHSLMRSPADPVRIQMASKRSSPTAPLPLRCWNCTVTCLFYFRCSLKAIRFPVSLEMSSGLTLGFPSAKMVSSTVHWHLSRADDVPRTQMLGELVVSYVGALVKSNSSGVWSTFAIWWSWNFSSWGPSPHLESWHSQICQWNS